MKQRCTYCGSGSHPTTHCPKTWGGYGQRQKIRCAYCGSNKHNHAGCPKIGKRPDHPGAIVLGD